MKEGNYQTVSAKSQDIYLILSDSLIGFTVPLYVCCMIDTHTPLG